MLADIRIPRAILRASNPITSMRVRGKCNHQGTPRGSTEVIISSRLRITEIIKAEIDIERLIPRVQEKCDIILGIHGKIAPRLKMRNIVNKDRVVIRDLCSTNFNIFIFIKIPLSMITWK